jgi:ABC-type uncharacterized transport system substrate-binding protein
LPREGGYRPVRRKEAEVAARTTLGMKPQILPVREPGDLERAFSAARRARALLQVDDAMLTANRARIADVALKNRMPTISGLSETVEAGGLMSHGPHYGHLYRRSATQVHQTLRGDRRGARPDDPPSLLQRADQVIE